MLSAPQTEIRGRIQTEASEGVQIDSPEAGLFEGFGPAIGVGLGKAGASAAFSITDPLVNYAQNWAVPFDDAFGTNIDSYLQTQRDESLNYVNSLKPDPYHTGKASELAYGFSSIIPQAALLAAGGPVTAAAGTGFIQGYTDYRFGINEGLDPLTAAQRGVLTAEMTALGIAAPASLGTGLVTKAATGAGLNVGLGGVQRFATGELLKSRGYEDMAAQYKVLDGWAIAGDAIIGAAFGGIAHYGSRANALSLNDTYQAHISAAPGAPTDPKSKNAHIEALERATEQLINGEPVEVGSLLSGRDNFIQRPKDEELSRAYDESLKEFGLAELMEEARAAEEQAAILRDQKPAHNHPEFADFAKTYENSRLGVHTAAKDFLIKKQDEDGNEHLLFVNDDDSSVTDYLTSGKKKRLDFDDKIIEKISNPDLNLIGHHNHPSGTSLSVEDISMLAYPGLKKVVAHGKDGEFSSARLTDEMRESLSNKSIDESQELLFDLYSKSEQETRNNLTEMMNQGFITREQANAVYYEIINRSLGNAGVIRYTDSHAVDAIPEDMYNNLQEASDNWVRSILDEGKINVSKDKNTVTVRPGEGVDRVFGGNEAGKTNTRSQESDKEGGGLSETIAKQILNEKPDTIIPTDSGPKKAAEVLSDVEREIKDIQTQRDAMDAAVICAIRNGK